MNLLKKWPETRSPAAKNNSSDSRTSAFFGSSPKPSLSNGYNAKKLMDYETAHEETWQIVNAVGCSVRSIENSDYLGTLNYGTSVTVAFKKRGSKECTILEPIHGLVNICDGSGGRLNAIPGNSDIFSKFCYKVIREEKAVVRSGLDLSAHVVGEFQINTIFEVTERKLNKDHIARLHTGIGWVSETFNPRSGNFGNIVEPLSLPSPLIYLVTRNDGVPVTKELEVDSQFVRNIPVGTQVEICAKKFTSFPSDSCIPRLKLSDGTGWITWKTKTMNKTEEYVRFLGVSHNNKRDMLGMNSDSSTSSSIDEVCENLSRASLSTSTKNKCVICLANPRTSTIVHKESGHIATCIECARILQARGDPCPVCRDPIDKVIQHYWV